MLEHVYGFRARLNKLWGHLTPIYIFFCSKQEGRDEIPRRGEITIIYICEIFPL